MYCLHCVYLPRIKSALQSFFESWNNHSISSERNLSPNQLLVRGALEQNTISQLPQLARRITSSTNRVTVPFVASHVEVPRSAFTPCMAITTQLSHCTCRFWVTHFTVRQLILLVDTCMQDVVIVFCNV